MKKNGILNSDISKVLSDLGHTDKIVIADCGLPVPEGVKKIDLSLTEGVPSFSDVLKVILQEMQVEKAILATEITSENSDLDEAVQNFLQENIEIIYTSHEELKRRTKEAKTIIRTGEATPYANVILHSGVIF